MISINATLIFQVIQFLILLFILNRLLFQPILKVIQEREDHGQRMKKEIKELELKTGQLKEEFTLREDLARKNAAKESADYRVKGMSMAQEFINVSQKEVAAIRKETAKDVEVQRNKVQPQLEDQAASLVEEMTEKVLGRRVLS